MSFAKPAAKAMEYEQSGSKKVDGRTVANKAYKQAVNNRSTVYTLWLLAVKHKVGLLLIGNVILVMNFILPEWPQLALGLIGK